MARRAKPADLPAIEAFLSAHIDGSMFPLENLRRHGLGASRHPRATEFWLAGGPSISAVVGVSREGYVFPQMPEPAPDLLRHLRFDLAGRSLQGIIGPLAQAHAVREALGFGEVALLHQGDEPHYALDLGCLRMPDVAGLSLRCPDDTDRVLMTEWRARYLTEVMDLSPVAARTSAESDVSAHLAAGSHRLLMEQGAPVAMTGFNAALEDIVQIGGVYTPPELRGQGLARKAVSLHLAEARRNGVRRAVLFAANTSAARAYEAVGFARIGEFSMLLFAKPKAVVPCQT